MGDLTDSSDELHRHCLMYYELAPSLAITKNAKYLAICGECLETLYLQELPAGADLIGETKGNA